jgi:hypothetical protein
MDSHQDTEHLLINPHIIVESVLHAHEFFTENRIEARYEKMALDLVRRYVSQEGTPREEDPFFAAALYIVTRHPWSHPNPLTKIEFANKLNMKESSLEWYTESICDKLGFSTLHDGTQLPFFMDPLGTIASVVDSVVRANVSEELVISIVSRNVLSPEYLAEKIVDQLCSVVKIVPHIFEQELYALVRKKIEIESKRVSDQIQRR